MRSPRFLSESKTLSQTLARSHNNYDLVRLVAALAVIVSHSFETNNPGHNVDYVSAYFHKHDDLGSLSVYTFFLLSGIFVTKSCTDNRYIVRFAALRFFRIYPGLFANLVVTLVLIGLFYGFPPTLWQFLLDPWTIKYFVENAFRFGGVAVSDPAAFPHAKLAGAVNYPLWSLPVEVQCYCLVGLFGVLGAFRRRAVFTVALLAAGAIYLALALTSSVWPFVIFFFFRFDDYSTYPVLFFMVGMALYVFRERIVLRVDVCLVLIAAFRLAKHTPLHLPALYAALAYAVLTLPNTSLALRLKPRNDYSYGIYIYGFVCQQMIASSFPGLDSYASLLLVVPLTVVFAALSWHVIEKPCIGLGRRLTAPLAERAAGCEARSSPLANLERARAS